MRPSWFLHTHRVCTLLDAKHYSHARAAQHLGISRTYWSQLINRRRSLTPGMRHLMLSSPLFKDVPDEQLWEQVPLQEAA